VKIRGYLAEEVKIRDYLTEDEHIDMVTVGNAFWLEFSALCEKYIAMAPADLKLHYEMYLGEKTSIYGRKRRENP